MELSLNLDWLFVTFKLQTSIWFSYDVMKVRQIYLNCDSLRGYTLNFRYVWCELRCCRLFFSRYEWLVVVVCVLIWRASYSLPEALSAPRQECALEWVTLTVTRQQGWEWAYTLLYARIGKNIPAYTRV